MEKTTLSALIAALSSLAGGIVLARAGRKKRDAGQSKEKGDED